MIYQKPEVLTMTVEEYENITGGNITTFNGHSWVTREFQ